jgi:hypothetical protein
VIGPSDMGPLDSQQSSTANERERTVFLAMERYLPLLSFLGLQRQKGAMEQCHTCSRLAEQKIVEVNLIA